MNETLIYGLIVFVIVELAIILWAGIKMVHQYINR
jgi:hypothetical protein